MADNWLEFEAGLPDDFLQSGVEEKGIVGARSELARQAKPVHRALRD